MAIMSGLSGNEIYCLNLKGLRPGELVIGNSVYSMGLFGALGPGCAAWPAAKSPRSPASFTKAASKSYERMMAEARERGGWA